MFSGHVCWRGCPSVMGNPQSYSIEPFVSRGSRRQALGDPGLLLLVFLLLQSKASPKILVLGSPRLSSEPPSLYKEL